MITNSSQTFTAIWAGFKGQQARCTQSFKLLQPLMVGLNVVAVLFLVLFSQALSPMATSLLVPRGERSGVIAPLLRHPKNSRSVARGLYIRQAYCPLGTITCGNGKPSSERHILCSMSISCLPGEGCCNIGWTCVVVSGERACCPIGKICSGNPLPVCHDPSDKLCPGRRFCCRESAVWESLPLVT